MVAASSSTSTPARSHPRRCSPPSSRRSALRSTDKLRPALSAQRVLLSALAEQKALSCLPRGRPCVREGSLLNHDLVLSDLIEDYDCRHLMSPRPLKYKRSQVTALCQRLAARGVASQHPGYGLPGIIRACPFFLGVVNLRHNFGR